MVQGPGMRNGQGLTPGSPRVAELDEIPRIAEPV